MPRIELGTEVDSPEAVLPGGRSRQGSDRLVPRGRHSRPRDEIEAIQRARILDAFVLVVARKGLNSTRIAAVCAEAGVSTREFYAVFASKNECLFTAFDIGTEVMCEAGAIAYRESGGMWEDRIRAALTRMFSLLANNPAFARLCLVEILAAGPPGAERLNRLIRRCRETYEADEDPGRPPELSEDACTEMLVGSVLRPVGTYVRRGQTERLLELVPQLAYSIALQVVGRDRALRQLRPAVPG